jgi:hypothetical protein
MGDDRGARNVWRSKTADETAQLAEIVRPKALLEMRIAASSTHENDHGHSFGRGSN